MRRIHPRSLWGLAQVLRRRNPQVPPDRIMENAVSIIRGLHLQGLELGPLDAFGPHECVHDRIDRAQRGGKPVEIVDPWDTMLKEALSDGWSDRRPWASPELR